MAASPKQQRIHWHEEVKITFDNHELGCFYESFAPLEDPLSSPSEVLHSPTLFLSDDEAA